jgi:hypothetical protein
MRLVLALLCASSIARADTETPAEIAPPHACEDPGVATRLGGLLHARRFADVHHAAVGLRVLCDAHDTWRILDDVALLRLEDRAWALTDLDDLARGPHAELANIVLAWAYVTDRDHESAKVVLARIPAPRAAAIGALGEIEDRDAFVARVHGLPFERQATELVDRYHAAHAKHPALAGVMSTILPGAGQLYAGSLQAAAVTFMLNALFIGATVELARDHQYITAAAAGTAASFFYVGGIINAVDLARRRNRTAMQPYADQIEELLVPELSGSQ